jgi:hypothetical protein
VEEALKEYFFKNFGENGQEAYRPVGCGFGGGGCRVSGLGLSLPPSTAYERIL